MWLKGSYDASQRRFRDLLNLQVPNSALRPKAQGYLNKIRAMTDDKKNHDVALEELQNENWDAANDSFRQIADRKGTLSNEARKQLEKIASAQLAISAVQEQIGFTCIYDRCKVPCDAAPKQSPADRAREELPQEHVPMGDEGNTAV
jgi:hypothetical protein